MLEDAPRIVELIGPAGAGKTAIANELKKRNNRVILSNPIYFRRLECVPFFLWNTIPLLPILIRLKPNNRLKWFASHEMFWLANLNGWHHILKKHISKSTSTLILDQGPVFMLAWLYYFNLFSSRQLTSPSVRKWYHRMLKQWSATLDMVIWIDADDLTLVKRVKSRIKWHGNKERSELEASEFLARWRESFETVLLDLEAEGRKPKLLNFNTEQEFLDKTVEKVLSVLNLMNK